MRKLFVSMMVSMDGFIEGPNKELEQFTDDEELLSYFEDILDNVDLLIYGRKSYELMIEYWPEAEGPFAEKMNKKPKLVFSNTLEKAQWNTTLVKGNVKETITQLKGGPGKDIVLFAGADMLSTLRKLDLIDEYRFIIYPVVLGSGTPLFKDMNTALPLQLMSTKAFGGGAVLLSYKPIN